MTLTAFLTNGAKIDWQEPSDFNFLHAIQLWRSAGYIQSPVFYISMHVVAVLTTDQGTAVTFPNMPLPGAKPN